METSHDLLRDMEKVKDYEDGEQLFLELEMSEMNKNYSPVQMILCLLEHFGQIAYSLCIREIQGNSGTKPDIFLNEILETCKKIIRNVVPSFYSRQKFSYFLEKKIVLGDNLYDYYYGLRTNIVKTCSKISGI